MTVVQLSDARLSHKSLIIFAIKSKIEDGLIIISDYIRMDRKFSNTMCM